jgi:hypothetical protein
LSDDGGKIKIDFEFLLYTEFDWLIGLTLLLPVIINSRSNWSETKLRIFCTASGVQELEDEKKGLV